MIVMIVWCSDFRPFQHIHFDWDIHLEGMPELFFIFRKLSVCSTRSLMSKNLALKAQQNWLLLALELIWYGLNLHSVTADFFIVVPVVFTFGWTMCIFSQPVSYKQLNHGSIFVSQIRTIYLHSSEFCFWVRMSPPPPKKKKGILVILSWLTPQSWSCWKEEALKDCNQDPIVFSTNQSRETRYNHKNTITQPLSQWWIRNRQQQRNNAFWGRSFTLRFFRISGYSELSPALFTMVGKQRRVPLADYSGKANNGGNKAGKGGRGRKSPGYQLIFFNFSCFFLLRPLKTDLEASSFDPTLFFFFFFLNPPNDAMDQLFLKKMKYGFFKMWDFFENFKIFLENESRFVRLRGGFAGRLVDFLKVHHPCQAAGVSWRHWLFSGRCFRFSVLLSISQCSINPLPTAGGGSSTHSYRGTSRTQVNSRGNQINVRKQFHLLLDAKDFAVDLEERFDNIFIFSETIAPIYWFFIQVAGFIHFRESFSNNLQMRVCVFVP